MVGVPGRSKACLTCLKRSKGVSHRHEFNYERVAEDKLLTHIVVRPAKTRLQAMHQGWVPLWGV
jgi:hypothetical protein